MTHDEERVVNIVVPRRGVVTVPRYHFDLVDSKTLSDEGGSELSDDSEAMDVAEELVRQLLRERPELKGRHYFILVTNQDGEEIGRCPLDTVH